MSTPYHYTPRMPHAPHPTPTSVNTLNVNGSGSHKRPIQNPYEKFTQPEFDAWIGGITSQLKRALGEEPEPREQEQEVDPNFNPYSKFLPPDLESDDEAIDDSFADLKARRAANNKGKARDPREGPGLGGKGGRNEPIEIASSDDEDAEEAKEVEMSVALLEDSESEEEEYTNEQEVSWEMSSPPAPAAEQDEEEVEEGSEEYEEYSGGEFDPEDQEHFEYSDEDKENQRPAVPRNGDILPQDLIRRPREEVYILDDDDIEEIIDDGKGVEEHYEEEEDEAEELEGEEGEGNHDEEYDEKYDEEYEEDYEEQDGNWEEDEDEGSRPTVVTHIVDDDDDEIEEIQPVENDTSFPPRSSLPPAESRRHVEIRDPWSGPRSYAQDFYSGGDRIPTGEQADPHHIGSTDDALPDIEDGVDIPDQVQPANDDTSFPPHEEKPEPPVDIQDPWTGPQTYAEDFYSEGDFQSIPGGVPNPHFITNHDTDIVQTSNKPVEAQPERYEFEQPMEDDTGFAGVQEGSQANIPVELPDLWAGPSTYAQDYYTGGDVRVSPDVPIDPSLLSGTAGTGDLEDDIDSFLTPAEASVYSSAERTPLSLEEADEEVEDDGQSRSSQRATGTLKSTRAQPIPGDAEIIDLDGSTDDEADANADIEAGEENDAELGDDMDDDRHVEVDEEPEHVVSDDFVQDDEQIDAEAEEDNEEVDDNSIVPPPASEIREEVSPEPRSEELKEHEMHDSAFNQASYTVQSPSPILKHAIFRETSLVVDMNSPAPEDKHHPSQHRYQNLILPIQVVEPPATPPKSASEELDVVETEEERLQIVTETAQQQESGSPAVLEEAADVSMQADDGQREPAAQEGANDDQEQVPLAVDTETVINDAGVPTEATFADLSEAILKPVGGSSEQEDYDIRSTPGSPGKEEATVQPALPTSSEGAQAELSKTAVESSLRSASPVAPHITGNGHETDAKELSKEDISVEALATETEIGNAEQASNDALEAEDAAEEDADGDFDYDDDTQYLEVLSISSGDLFNVDVDADAYSVEEVRTQGRSTEELGDRETSFRVDSIGPEEVGELHEIATAAHVEEQEQSEAARQNSSLRDLSPSKEAAQVEPVTATQEAPLDDKVVSYKTQSALAEMADVEMLDTEVTKDTSTSVPEPSVPTTNKEEVEAGDETIGRASSVLHDLPMPVVANANVADPVDLPVTPLFEEPGPELLIPVLHSGATTPEPMQLESNADTERNEDVVSTSPAEIVPLQEITDTASVEPMSDTAHDAAPADEDTSPATILPVDPVPSPTGVVMTSNPTMPVLVQDPYPYSLSTPGTAAEIDVNELVTESEKDNDPALRFVYSDVSNAAGTAKAKSPSAPTAAYVPDVFTNAAPSNAEGSSQSPKDETTTPQQPSKRKRESKKTGSAPRPRGRPRKSAKLQVDLPEATSNETILYNPAKGKSAESQNKTVTGEPSFTSQASSVGQGGQTLLKAGSRSSSIASTIPDDKSFVSQPSPTITKPATVAVPNIAITPLPLFHAHGAARKAQAQKLQALVQQRRPAPSRTPSLPQIPDSNGASVTPKETPLAPKEEKALEDVPESSNTPMPSPVKAEANGSTSSDPKPALETSPTKPADSKPAESEPATPTAAIPSSSMQVASSPTVAALKASASTAKASPSHHSTTFSSPVTRSHCRYHKISLPKEEGGTRVCFLVPGCSLNDKELMEEAEIEDHGDATTEDSLRMVKDIESLGFDLDLIGIIRQLVGLDILREQEVYYLPLPGEEITRKHVIRKTPSEKSATIRASTEKHHASSPSYSGSISIRSPVYPKAPPSVAESTSTTLSALRNMVDPDGDSASSTDEDDMSEAEAPRAKRVKPSPPDEPGVMGPPASQTKGKQKLKYKRVDATYQPGDGHEQESEEETSTKKRRKSTASRGLKRARTSDAIAGHSDGNTRQSKKLKAQMTAPQLSSSPQKPENT